MKFPHHRKLNYMDTLFCNLVDKAAQKLDIKKAGLASLCAHYNLPSSDEYKELKSKCQLADWRKRPMEKEMIRYGCYDVHYL